MRFLSIDPRNYNKHVKIQNTKTMKNGKTMKQTRKNEKSKKHLTRLQTLNNAIKNGKHVFLLIYMEGCGPCNATRPEWKKVENVLNEKYTHKYNDIIVVDIDHTLLKYVTLPLNPTGFPSMKYISKKGKYVQEYENADIKNKNRQVDSFIAWIESTIKKNNIQPESNAKIYGGFTYGITQKTRKRTRRTNTN